MERCSLGSPPTGSFGSRPETRDTDDGHTNDLDRLALELRLTRMQRAFAEALATDRDRNQTRAARAAGCGRGAEVTASKWLRLAKVQTYTRAVTEAAEAESRAKTAASLSSLERALIALSGILRANIGDCLRQTADGKCEVDLEALAKAPPGAFTYRVTKRGWSLEANPLKAARALLNYYLRSAQPPPRAERRPTHR